MSELAQRIRTDLTASMKARDEVVTSTLRMVLAALQNESVAGSTARELGEDDVLRVLSREAKKRAESAEIYSAASRPELADREIAELTIIKRYLPVPLSEAEIEELVVTALDQVRRETGNDPTMKQLGLVIKAANARASGRADGSVIAAAVKKALGSGR